jgi:hypothetical protein
MKSILFIILTMATILSGCTNFYQVINTKSISNLKMLGDTCYVYENDTIKVIYNLWGNYGKMRVSICNKLNIPLYVDWKKCMFFSGTQGIPFFNDNIITETKSRGHSLYWGYGYSTNSGSSTATSVMQDRVSYIPQKAIVTSQSLMITPEVKGIWVEKYEVTQDSSSNDYNKLVSVDTKQYSLAETPQTLRIVLTYSTTESFQKEFYIDNSFYVDNIKEMSINQFSGNHGISPYEKGNRYYIYIPYSRHRRKWNIIHYGLNKMPTE